MRREFAGFALALLCVVILSAGCAKKQAVREEAAPPVTTPAPQPTQPAQPPTPPAEEKVQPQQIQESPLTAQDGGSAAETTGDLGLQPIYFEFDSYALSPEARETLAKDADLLKNKKNQNVVVEGHTDERGTGDYNLALGEKRAKSAMSYLITLGVPADRLSTISYGEEKPAVPGSDESAWIKNRRVSFSTR
jgi:peptidoglycan-associated lipoprotein